MKPTYLLSFALLAAALFAGTCSAATTTVGVGETIPVGGTTTTVTTTEPTTTEPTGDEPADDSGSGPGGIIHQVGIVPADGGEAPPGDDSSWEGAEILGSGSTTPETETPEETAPETEGSAEPTLYTEDEGTPTAPQGQNACAPAFALLLLAAFALRS